MEIYFRLAEKDELQEVTPLITAMATRKLNNLKKYLSHRKSIAKVYVELGKESDSHKKGNVWRSLINIDCDGQRYTASAMNEQVETALNESIQELDKELRRSKNRERTMLRKGSGWMKNIFRGFSTL